MVIPLKRIGNEYTSVFTNLQPTSRKTTLLKQMPIKHSTFQVW